MMMFYVSRLYRYMIYQYIVDWCGRDRLRRIAADIRNL